MFLLALILVAALPATAPAASWLDQPLAPWASGPSVPAAAARSASSGRACLVDSPASTEADQLRTAGWRPFQLFDRPIARGALLVLGGLRDLTGDCAPADFQAFVFVGGRFAGTLSPVEMTTAQDGVVGTIRLVSDDVVTAEFARYRSGDSECCPSGRVRVTYRIERGSPGPRAVPVDVKVLRE